MVRGREIEKIYMYATPNSPKTAISFTELSAVAANQIDTIQIDYLQSEISIYLKHIKTQGRSEEHTSELQSRGHLVCRLLLEKKRRKTCHSIPRYSEYTI